MVAGERALVISMRQQMERSSEEPMPGQARRLLTTQAGTDDGFFVFSPQSGRLFARRREGLLTGAVVVRSASGDMTFKNSFSYTNTIEAVR